jgi:hypothetical protein
MKFSDITSLEFSDFDDLYSWISDNRQVNVFRFKVENSNPTVFCGLVKIEETSDNVLVLFNGAVDREKHDYETYQRWSWIENIPHNVLIIPDITLAQGKFALGWGVGRPDAWFMADASDFIKTFLQYMSLDVKKTILYGSSAGGFQAFQCGILLRRALVIMENPQTNVFNYYKHHYTPLIENSDFGNSESVIAMKYGERFDLIKSIDFSSFLPKTIYLQNVNDHFHYSKHLIPFKKSLELSVHDSTIIDYRLFEGGRTHSPGGFESFYSMIEDAFLYINTV